MQCDHGCMVDSFGRTFFYFSVELYKGQCSESKQVSSSPTVGNASLIQLNFFIFESVSVCSNVQQSPSLYFFQMFTFYYSYL